ncbi:hypothetical protein F4604DRAFT_1691447 [Suillus subluteus]|nr:hypothetical protein F4604DRAFT_1691447 [Suillus subluteus]
MSQHSFHALLHKTSLTLGLERQQGKTSSLSFHTGSRSHQWSRHSNRDSNTFHRNSRNRTRRYNLRGLLSTVLYLWMTGRPMGVVTRLSDTIATPAIATPAITAANMTIVCRVKQIVPRQTSSMPLSIESYPAHGAKEAGRWSISARPADMLPLRSFAQPDHCQIDIIFYTYSETGV